MDFTGSSHSRHHFVTGVAWISNQTQLPFMKQSICSQSRKTLPGKRISRILMTAAVISLAVLAARAQTSSFLSGHLAVLRAGDGVLDLELKQSPAFIDQFDAGGFNSSPSATVKIPTNGSDAFFFNGHAATEGNLTRSADRKLLAFAGYGGVSLLQSNGTPSLLDIPRGFCTVDATGTIHTTLYKTHGLLVKMNPRGVVTDGSNSFWGCGNSFGSYYYNPNNSAEPVEFREIPNSRAIRIVNNTLYTSLNGPDGTAGDMPAGIFAFQDGRGNAAPLPHSADSSLRLLVSAANAYTKNVGFDINAGGTIAYTSDTSAGIQKYVKTNGAWKFEYNFSIPQSIPQDLNHATGCFGLVVDFSRSTPIIYATTTEGYGGSVNSNRVVRIVDTNATAVVTTLAQALSSKIAYRGIDFTPEITASKP